MGEINTMGFTGMFSIEPLIATNAISSKREFDFWSSWGLETKNNAIADSIKNKSFNCGKTSLSLDY